MRMGTSGLAVIGAVTLLLISGAPRGQTRPDPSESAIATPQPDEVPAPQDHLMASQCLAEVRARFPAATYDFLDLAFSRSKALGDIIRVDFAAGNAGAQDEEKAGRVHLVCLKRQPDASLEVHLFHTSARVIPGKRDGDGSDASHYEVAARPQADGSPP